MKNQQINFSPPIFLSKLTKSRKKGLIKKYYYSKESLSCKMAQMIRKGF